MEPSLLLRRQPLMGHTRLLLAALTLASAALGFDALAGPRPTLACSCMPPGPLAAIAGLPDRPVAVVTIGLSMGGYMQAHVERWLQGAIPDDGILLRGGPGATAVSSCDVHFNTGERWVLALNRDHLGGHSAVSCAHHGRLGTPDGDALLAEAVTLFGVGVSPQPPEPEAPAPLDVSPWLGGLGWVAVVVAAGAAVLGLVALVARRRPSN